MHAFGRCRPCVVPLNPAFARRCHFSIVEKCLPLTHMFPPIQLYPAMYARICHMWVEKEVFGPRFYKYHHQQPTKHQQDSIHLFPILPLLAFATSRFIGREIFGEDPEHEGGDGQAEGPCRRPRAAEYDRTEHGGPPEGAGDAGTILLTNSFSVAAAMTCTHLSTTKSSCSCFFRSGPLVGLFRVHTGNE